jgi:hypothetical protein
MMGAVPRQSGSSGGSAIWPVQRDPTITPSRLSRAVGGAGLGFSRTRLSFYIGRVKRPTRSTRRTDVVA